jgi:hypothetical protein
MLVVDEDQTFTLWARDASSFGQEVKLDYGDSAGF